MRKEKKRDLRFFVMAFSLCITLALSGCANMGAGVQLSPADLPAFLEQFLPPEDIQDDQVKDEAEKNGEVYILYTGDVHCGVEKGFGYAGLYEIMQSLEDQGYTTILVDDGDSIQGEAMGTFTEGEANVELMNEVGYDLAIPGNHEFDYSMDQLFKLADMADHEYLSCNLNKDGELLFEPYKIVEACGIKIGFVGVTTPMSLTTSNPKNFKDENGKTVYDFMQDGDGEKLYKAVQKAVDEVREKGVDHVYLIAHLGNETLAHPWTCEDVISHTNGIDVMLDGHSHDTEQLVIKNNKDEDVVRSSTGTKMQCIGYSHITADGIEDTGIWTWANDIDAPTLLGIDNKVSRSISETKGELDEILTIRIADIDYDLLIHDPEDKDEKGNPVRIVRKSETNLGDFAADAIREACNADIGLVNGGGIRVSIQKGPVTYGDILAVFPFNNELCVIEATGQQILDALEWTSRSVPEENGGFLQVSGLSYEIDPSVEDPCKADENGMMVSIEGRRRVSNVMADGVPLDPAAKYRVAGVEFVLLNNGDGMTAFDGAKLLESGIMLDNQALEYYLSEVLGGDLGDKYADPYGEGRIKIVR